MSILALVDGPGVQLMPSPGRGLPSEPSDTMPLVADPVDLPIAESLSREYEAMLVRLERARERAQRLRELAEQATDQVVADERLVRSLAEVLGVSPQATIHDLGGALRGQRLREVAVEVLQRHIQPGGEVHYREWFELLRSENLAIAGRNPLATFLAQVSRSDAVEAVGSRSGRYRLRVVA